MACFLEVKRWIQRGIASGLTESMKGLLHVGLAHIFKMGTVSPPKERKNSSLRG